MSGSTTPDGVGEFDIQLSNFAVINGDYTSVSTTLKGNKHVVVVNKKGDASRIVVEAGMTTPSAHTISWITGNGGPVLNSEGIVGIPASSYLSTNPNVSNTELVSSEYLGAPNFLVSSGDAEPGSDGTMYLRTPLSPSINGAGQLAAAISLANTSAGSLNNEAIYRINSISGEIVKIVRKGDDVPNDQGQFIGTALQSNAVFFNPYIADDGSVAFSAGVINSANPVGIWVGDGTHLTQVARYGDTMPDNSSLSGIWGLDYASTAMLAFTAHTVGDSAQDAIYLHDANGLHTIMNTNTIAPNGERFRGPSRTLKVSDTGKVAFSARMYPSYKTGMFAGDINSLTQLGLAGEAAPENHGVFAFFSDDDGSFSISDNGLIAFQARLIKDGQQHQAIYFYDASGVQEVISTFDTIEGIAISDLLLAGRTDAQAEAINNDGDIVFKFTLVDGRSGVAVWRRKGGREKPLPENLSDTAQFSQ